MRGDLGMTDEERLAAYDKVYAGLTADRERIIAQMEALRAAGKTKTATYRQLLGDKLSIQAMMARFENCGIQEAR